MKKILLPPLLLISLCSLNGCKELPSSATICKENPDLCRGLNEDGWCQSERDSVILKEYDLHQQKTELGIYHSLLAWEDYRDCIELASHIEVKRLKIRQSQRVEGYLRAEEAIETYKKETTNAKHPSLLWYHWSREGNKAAYAKFVALEESGQLNTPELVINIAAHYAENEKERAIGYLLKALTMYEDKSDIDPKIFSRLTTLMYQVEDYKHSYIWALVTKEEEAGKVNMALINEHSHLSTAEKLKAEGIADYIHDHLGEQDFIPSRRYAFK